METVIIVTLLIITLAMIGVILIQRSEGGGLGIGGGSSMGGLMTSRGTKDFLTRTTAILASLFMGLCLVLTILATQQSRKNSLLTSLVNESDKPAVNAQAEIDSAMAPQIKEDSKAVIAPKAAAEDTSEKTPVKSTPNPAKAPVA